MTGFIKLHRQISTCPTLKKDFLLRSFFIHLLLRAEYREHERRGKRGSRILARGQTWESQLELAKEIGVTRGKILRMLSTLEKAGMIAKTPITSGKKTDHMGILISICNYDKYQGIEKAPDHMRSESRSYSKNKELRIKDDLSKQRKEVLVERPPEPPPLFSEFSEDQPQEVLELVETFNQTKTELLPPIDVRQLKAHVVRAAAVALRNEPCLETWKKAIVRVGKSAWLTGQEASKTGKMFDTATVFEFLLSREKRLAVLEGKYDMSRKKEVVAPKPMRLYTLADGTTFMGLA